MSISHKVLSSAQRSLGLKIKHFTLIGEYYNGGLKDIDIETKFKALKLTWIKRLFDDSDHPWKIIPTKFLKLPNHNLISHRNFSVDQTSLSKIQGIPVLYVDLLRYWGEFSKFELDDHQILLSESLLFNYFIKIGERSIFLKNFSEISINTVGDVFNMDGSIGDFEELVQKVFKAASILLGFSWLTLSPKTGL